MKKHRNVPFSDLKFDRDPIDDPDPHNYETADQFMAATVICAALCYVAIALLWMMS